MALADLKTLMNASAQNMSQFKGLSAAYGILLGGTPSIDGYTALINTNNTTNFGAGAAGPTFNDENIYINTINALYQGNATAKANFDAIVAGSASIQDALTAVYNYIIPASARTQAGLDYFKSQASFYAGRAAELGVAGTNGTALVAFASLTKIAVDNDIAGLGDTINDLRAAVDAGSAVIPQGGTAFTPLETADGAAFDVDDAPGGTGSGGTVNLTTEADVKSGNVFNAPLVTLSGLQGAVTLQSFDSLTGTGTNPTLNAVVNNNNGPITPTLKGVETVNLNATAAVTVNLANATGVKAVNNNDSSATLTVSNIGAGVALGATNTALAQNFTFQDLSGAADATTLTLNNVSGGVTLGATNGVGALETVNLVSNGGSATTAVNTGGVVTGAIKTLNISGSGALTGLATNAATTTVDASKFAANLTASIGAGTVAVNGGTGVDTLTFGTAGNATVDAGAGNDVLIFGSTLTVADKVNGGDGTDILRVSDAGGLGVGAQVTNIETLDFTGATAAVTFDANNVAGIATVLVNDGAGANNYTLSNLAKTATVQVRSDTAGGVGNVTISQKGAADAGSITDSLALVLNTTGATAPANLAVGTITADAIETLNLAIGTDAATTTVTAISGSTLNSVVITGGAVGQAINLGAVGDADGAALINASGVIGNLTVAGGTSAQAIIGGSGNDSITGGGRAAFTGTEAGDSLTGGAGSDAFVLDASDSTATLANAAVTGPFSAAQGALFTTITDLNLGTGTTSIDTVNLAAAFNFTGAETIVNGGAVAALTGASFGAAVDALINNGILDTGAASGADARAGLFSWGGDTFLIVNEAATAATAYTAGDTVVIKVTGVTGILDAGDITL